MAFAVFPELQQPTLMTNAVPARGVWCQYKCQLGHQQIDFTDVSLLYQMLSSTFARTAQVT